MLLDNRLLWLAFITALALHPDEATAVVVFELYGSGFLSDDGVTDKLTPTVEGSPVYKKQKAQNIEPEKNNCTTNTSTEYTACLNQLPQALDNGTCAFHLFTNLIKESITPFDMPDAIQQQVHWHRPWYCELFSFPYSLHSLQMQWRRSQLFEVALPAPQCRIAVLLGFFHEQTLGWDHNKL